MPIVVSAGSGTSFEPCPAGLHQAVCVDVVDMGVIEVTYSGKTKKQHKVRLIWQVDELLEDGKPYLIQKRYTASLHEKASLRAELESWRGKPFSFDELVAFDLEKLIGVNCQLNVIHVTKNGTTYANVSGIVPLGKVMGKIKARDYIRVKDRTPEESEPEPSPEVTEDDIPF